MNAPLILNKAVVPMPRKQRDKKPEQPRQEVVTPLFPKKVKVNYPKRFDVQVVRLEVKKENIIKTIVEKVKEVAKPEEWKKRIGPIQNEMVTFRIKPHAGITNNNKRLWKAIYQLFSMYESLSTRREKWNSLTYREKDLFWYDIVFRQDKGKRSIEFYVTTTEYLGEKLKRKLENKMDATFEKVEAATLQVPKENTIVNEVKYLKHDIFSINTNTQNDHQTPIAAILNAVDELQNDGDFARLSICAEAVNRSQWIKNAGWAVEKMGKGKVPQRATINGKKVYNAGKIVFSNVLNEINSVLVDAFQAMQNVFFKSDKNFDKKKVIDKPFSLEDEIGTRKLSGASLEKMNLPVMKTRIRIASHSADRLTRETLAESLGLAFSEVAENNELQAFRARSRCYEIIDELNTFRLSPVTAYDGNVNLMSTDELAKIALQMPQKDLQRRYNDALSVKSRIEAHVPVVFRKDDGLYLGKAEYKDTSIPIYFPMSNPDEFYRGYVLIGGQGAGKDTAAKNLVVEGNLKHNISFIIPEVIVEEGERGMADGIRDSLPPERVIDLDFGDPDYIIPLDLTEVLPKLGRDGGSRFADEISDFLNMGELTRSKHILKVVAKASGGSLMNIKRLIEEEGFREEVTNKLIDDGNLRLAEDLVKLGSQDEIMSKADPILSRLGDFFDNDKLHDIFCQPPKPEVNFAEWMQQGKVIICRIPARKLGQPAARTLVHWLTLKVVMTRMLMSKKEQSNGAFIVFNEPEQYATEGLTALMGRIGTEFRKEQMGSLYAFHHWNKLPTSLQENLQGGGVQQFLFANDHKKTFELSEHRFSDTIPLEEAVKIPVHHAIVSVRAGGDLQPAFIVHMAPPVSKRFQQYDNSFLTKRHSRMYGRHWKTLQNGEMFA